MSSGSQAEPRGLRKCCHLNEGDAAWQAVLSQAPGSCEREVGLWSPEPPPSCRLPSATGILQHPGSAPCPVPRGRWDKPLPSSGLSFPSCVPRAASPSEASICSVLLPQSWGGDSRCHSFVGTRLLESLPGCTYLRPFLDALPCAWLWPSQGAQGSAPAQEPRAEGSPTATVGEVASGARGAMEGTAPGG